MYDYADKIKTEINMVDICLKYGFKVDRSNYVCCPFHGEKTPSLKLYSGNRGFYCFGCGEHGSVIDFVIKFFGLDFKQAIAKLNEDFCLGLPIGQRLDRRQKEQIAKRRFLAEKEKKAKMAEYQQIKDEYNAALDEWARLDRQKREYRPKNENCTLHPLFVEAIMNLSHAEHRLDTAEMELYLYETRNRGNT